MGDEGNGERGHHHQKGVLKPLHGIGNCRGRHPSPLTNRPPGPVPRTAPALCAPVSSRHAATTSDALPASFSLHHTTSTMLFRATWGARLSV